MADEPLVGLTDQVQYPLATKPARHKKIYAEDQQRREIGERNFIREAGLRISDMGKYAYFSAETSGEYSMKAVRIHQFGGPEVLTYEDVPDPVPPDDQVLVRVRACALNHLDVWVRKGLPGVKLPHILGSDIAGEVVEAGDYVSGFKTGQRVLLAPMHFCGHCAQCVAGVQNQCRQFTALGNAVDGGNCELIAVPAANVIPIPDSLDFNHAASVPLVFLTAWHMLVGRAGIRLGQTVLVLGASSGVGIAAIQIAKLFHCRVITTAGDESKLEKGRQLGADYGINHYQQKISDEVKKITNKEGVDIVVEHVGAATWDESVRSLKSGGTLVTCGATTGPNVGLDLRHLFGRQLTLLGSYMGTMGELHEVLRHVFAGKLKPVVDRAFPLSEIRAAHEYLEKSQMFGKVVVNP
jgi:NADPH:quinone reductase-like Zn-dependent oxidoreductase